MASNPASPTEGAGGTRDTLRPAVPRRLPSWMVPSSGDLTLLAFFGLLRAIPPYDTDLWWHLRAGEWILAEGRVPRADVFSFTALGQPWIAHEWLAEVGMALAYRLAGLEAMAALQAVLLVGALAIVYRHLRADGASSGVALPLLLATLFLLLPAAHPRPYLVTVVGLALLLHLLHVHRRRRALLVVAVPVLFVPWANLHAGFAIGLGAIALVAVGEAWQRRALPLDVLALLGLAAAASAVNPYGLRLLAYPLQYRAGSIHYALITEWASLDFHEPFAWLVMGFLASAGVLLASRRAPGWRVDALLLTAFGAMALMSVRNIPLLAIVATPILARQIVGRQGGGRSMSASGGVATHGHAGAAAATVGVRRGVIAKMRRLAAVDKRFSGVPLTALALMATTVGIARGPSTPSAFDPALWPGSAGWPMPYAALEQLGEPAAGPGGDDLLNDYGWGGYLIWSSWPEQRVFIDGRADVYGDEILGDYADIVGLAPGWSDLLDRYGVRRVLLPPDTPLVEALRLVPEWSVAYEDEVAVLLGR